MFSIAKIKVKLLNGGSLTDASSGLTIKDNEEKLVNYSLSIQKLIKDNILIQVIEN